MLTGVRAHLYINQGRGDGQIPRLLSYTSKYRKCSLSAWCIYCHLLDNVSIVVPSFVNHGRKRPHWTPRRRAKLNIGFGIGNLPHRKWSRAAPQIVQFTIYNLQFTIYRQTQRRLIGSHAGHGRHWTLNTTPATFPLTSK